jgi:hypothetical protein
MVLNATLNNKVVLEMGRTVDTSYTKSLTSITSINLYCIFQRIMKTSCIDGILQLFEVQEGASFKIAGQFYTVGCRSIFMVTCHYL